MFKKFLGSIAYMTILAVMAVTAKADTTFTGKLSGAQTVPPNASKATGLGTVVLNDAETRITISLDFSGLGSNQTAAHIHGPAAPGSNAPIVFNLGSQGAPNGSLINLSAAVTPRQVAQLKAGKWYFDVHSTRLFGGEIRAQLLPVADAATESVCYEYSESYGGSPDDLYDELINGGRFGKKPSDFLMNSKPLKFDELWNQRDDYSRRFYFLELPV